MSVIAEIETAIAPIEDTVNVLIAPYQPTSMRISELSSILLDRATSQEVRDLIWRHIVKWARDKEPYSTLIAIRLALPGIRHAAKRVKAIYPHTADSDAENEVIAGFLTGLSTVDIDEPRICSRLCGSAFSAGRTWARRQIASARAAQTHRSQTPRPQYGHVDLVLARAVAENIITFTAASLIYRTRFDGDTIAKAAASAGLETTCAIRIRKSAERAVKDWLTK